MLLKESGHDVDTTSAGPDDVSALSKKLPKFGDKKSTKSGVMFFLKAGPHKQEIKQRAAFACDGTDS